MTNFEKWKDECIDILEGRMSVVDGKPARCGITDCKVCLFCGCGNCRTLAREWLLAEYKEPEPKLTKREREFLDSIFKEEGYKVSRGCFGLYMVFGEENVVCARLNQDMFTFIKRGESWTFEELMKLEVEE